MANYCHSFVFLLKTYFISFLGFSKCKTLKNYVGFNIACNVGAIYLWKLYRGIISIVMAIYMERFPFFNLTPLKYVFINNVLYIAGK